MTLFGFTRKHFALHCLPQLGKLEAYRSARDAIQKIKKDSSGGENFRFSVVSTNQYLNFRTYSSIEKYKFS